MISYMSNIISDKITDNVKCGKATDVYQLASELRSQWALLTEDEYAALVSKIATEVKGAAVLWERHRST